MILSIVFANYVEFFFMKGNFGFYDRNLSTDMKNMLREFFFV